MKLVVAAAIAALLYVVWVVRPITFRWRWPDEDEAAPLFV